jgi:3'-phosphoadenosine 5'-phosphosulfate sulfotransferase (PAPS reductase)/FAD synthetase
MAQENTKKVEAWQLKQCQSLPLPLKVRHTEIRIKRWYEHFDGNVYISFSGGKDSTVLLDIARKMYPNIPAVFVDTGLEYPEIRKFVKTIINVEWLKPKLSFKEVLHKYGFPVVSKENAQKIHEIRHTKSAKLKNKRLHGDEKGHGKLPEKWKYLLNVDFKIPHKCCDVMKKAPIKTL